MSATAVRMMEVVPESQRLIAVSLGKIAASRGQKGGINLHKNLLVATVLHKARTVYMMQHYNRQRAAAAAAAAVNGSSTPTMVGESASGVTQPCQPVTTATATPAGSPSSPSTPQSQNIEMRDETETATAVPSSSAPATTTTKTARENSAHATFHAAPLTGPHHADAPSATLSTAAAQQTTFPGGAQVSSVHMSETEDKENSPPSPRPSCPAVESAIVGVVVPTPVSPECEARLHEGNPRKPDVAPMTHGRNNSNGGSALRGENGKSTAASCFISCVLKRRRLTDNENVSAPKVRILEVKVALDKGSSNGGGVTEPMLCDSPQISSLVNIFNVSFANGLAGNGTLGLGQTSGDHSVRGLVSHKLSENLTCAKEMSFGSSMDTSLRQPLVLSV